MEIIQEHLKDIFQKSEYKEYINPTNSATVKDYDNSIVFNNNNDLFSMNIYEFLDCCYKWAFAYGYCITVEYDFLGCTRISTKVRKNYSTVILYTEVLEGFKYPYIPKYVITACIWIYNNIKENNDRKHII